MFFANAPSLSLSGSGNLEMNNPFLPLLLGNYVPNQFASGSSIEISTEFKLLLSHFCL